jgi:hypothetical protein
VASFFFLDWGGELSYDFEMGDLKKVGLDFGLSVCAFFKFRSFLKFDCAFLHRKAYWNKLLKKLSE